MSESSNYILLVDDSRVCHDVMKLVLLLVKYPKYEFISALTGTEALKITSEKAKEIKLIIIDLSLPDMTVIELYGSFKKNNLLNSVPKIFQSGRDFTKCELDKLEEIAPGEKFILIKKPCPPDEFLKVLHEILGEDVQIINLPSKSKTNTSYVDIIKRENKNLPNKNSTRAY